MEITDAPPAPAATTVRLGANQYGKAEVRLVRVTRDTDRHEIEDLTVTTQLRGAALADSYTSGDNAKVVATDTQAVEDIRRAPPGVLSFKLAQNIVCSLFPRYLGKEKC